MASNLTEPECREHLRQATGFWRAVIAPIAMLLLIYAIAYALWCLTSEGGV